MSHLKILRDRLKPWLKQDFGKYIANSCYIAICIKIIINFYKQEFAANNVKKMANIALGLFKLLLGAIFLLLGILGILRWLPQLLDLVKGSIGPFVAVLGLMLVMLAFSDFRD